MKLYTVAEIANMLGYKEDTVRKKIAKGDIKSEKIVGTNAVRVSQEEINRLIGKEDK